MHGTARATPVLITFLVGFHMEKLAYFTIDLAKQMLATTIVTLGGLTVRNSLSDYYTAFTAALASYSTQRL